MQTCYSQATTEPGEAIVIRQLQLKYISIKKTFLASPEKSGISDRKRESVQKYYRCNQLVFLVGFAVKPKYLPAVFSFCVL